MMQLHDIEPNFEGSHIMCYGLSNSNTDGSIKVCIWPCRPHRMCV